VTATTDLIVRELGRRLTVTADDPDFASYCRDESGVRGDPDVVARVESVEQVTAVLRIADEHDLFVTPRGAGSGKTGGCVATRGGIILSTERMQRILELDEADLVAVVEPGVITEALATTASDHGLFYPPDPASLAFSSIGGNIAANAGGPSAFKYGVTGTYVLGLQVGLIGGEILDLGRRTAKGVSGYDLLSPFVGSEGTFGVVTRATLALVPRPRQRCTLLAAFSSRRAAGDAVTALLTSGSWPRAIELLDAASLEVVRAHLDRPVPSAAAALVVEVDGDDAERALERCGESLAAHGASEIAAATSEAESRSLWQARRAISPGLKAAYPHKVSEDICVPRGKIVAMLERIDALAAASGIPMAAYGHAGDGNLHVNFLLAEAVADERLEPAIERLFRDAIELGGTLSGEHGIGTSKRRFMPIEHSEASLAWQRRLKGMWDPKGLCNPGKVLPTSRGWRE